MNNKIVESSVSHLVVPIFFVLYLVVGACIFMDYGIPIDDITQQKIGLTSLYYLVNLFGFDSTIKNAPHFANPVQIFDTQIDRDYGVAFELPAEALIKLFDIQNDLWIFYFRHFLTFLIFFIAAIFFYKLIKERWSSWKWGLLGVTCFILSPRIFADSFYNSKDLVFLSIITIGLYTLFQFLHKRTTAMGLVHAFVCAYAIDVRIMGIMLPGLTMLGVGVLILNKEWRLKDALLALLSFSAITATLVVVMWPWLWAHPIGNFVLAFQNMAKFRHSVNMIFLGEIINSKHVPWYYLPVWIAITTPILYLTCFAVGLIAIFRECILSWIKRQFRAGLLYDCLVTLLFFSPILATIALNSVLYNGWRQLYFVYSALVYIAICGAHLIYALLQLSPSKNRWRTGFMAAFIVSWVATAAWMIQAHPYQYLYFNQLSGRWEDNFDLDYWGLAYRKPMEEIFFPDDGKIKVIFNAMFWKFGAWQLPVGSAVPFIEPKKRVLFKEVDDESCADYVITTMRNGAKQYYGMPGYSLLDELKVGGRVIYATFKRNKPLDDAFPQKSGVDLSFAKENNGRCFLKTGWVPIPEDWGVWSNEKSATLHLNMPADNPQVLLLGLRAFVNQAHPTQRVLITVNGRHLPLVTLTQFDHNLVRIPLTEADRKTSSLDIELAIPDAISPSQLKIANDDRQLGVGLQFVRFE